MNYASKKNPGCRALMRIGLFLLLLPGSPVFAETIDISKPVSESLKPDGIYWTFDDGTIGESFPVLVEDASGNGYQGSLKEGKVRPAPVYIQGKFGTGLHFLPAPGETTFDPANPNPSVSWRLSDTPGIWDETKLDLNKKSFTAGAWIKLDKVNTGEAQGIFLLLRGISPRQWYFMLFKDPNDEWVFDMTGSRSSEKTTELNDGGWHHVAFSFDSGEGTNQITFWLDGQQLGDLVEHADAIVPPESVGERIFIVGEINTANYSNGFVGSLDDVFVTSGVHSFTASQPIR